MKLYQANELKIHGKDNLAYYRGLDYSGIGIKWTKRKALIGEIFGGVLSGLIMDACTFTSVNAQSVTWLGCELERCDLNGCNLSFDTFIDCKFKHSTLKGCNFSYTKFINCTVDDCNLYRCNLDKAHIHGGAWDVEHSKCIWEDTLIQASIWEGELPNILPVSLLAEMDGVM